MRKFILAIALLISLTAFPSAFADSDSHNRSVSGALSSIRESQDIESNTPIDCNDITNEEFEELGDAVMGVMQPDPEQHELMDNMMGGEGSESLKSMHIMMGQRYLGCVTNTGGMMTGFGGMGMMGGMPMMGGMFNNNWTNNPNTYQGSDSQWGINTPFYGGFGMMSGFGWIFMLIFWGLAIFGLIALIQYIGGRKRK